MTPSTASRIGAMLLAKKVTTPWVLMPFGAVLRAYPAETPRWRACELGGDHR